MFWENMQKNFFEDVFLIKRVRYCNCIVSMWVGSDSIEMFEKFRSRDYQTAIFLYQVRRKVENLEQNRRSFELLWELHKPSTRCLKKT